MKSEPTGIIELVRILALAASFFGIAINAEEQALLVAGVGAVVTIVSVGLAIWNRLSVFSPATTQKIADRAAATGDTDIGKPPEGPT